MVRPGIGRSKNIDVRLLTPWTPWTPILNGRDYVSMIQHQGRMHIAISNVQDRDMPCSCDPMLHMKLLLYTVQSGHPGRGNMRSYKRDKVYLHA